MDTCIFCQIISGAIPAHKVYEDSEFLAFLDIRPLSPGHTLIIPKKHYRFVWDVPNIGNYFVVVQKIAKALQKISGTDEIYMKVIGEEVPHAHVWVYTNPDKAVGDKNDFAAIAEKLRAELG
ncbi:MAG: HIT domain-containing protein [Candidatus Kaiserbacteria bacterium]|nr:HIT domain-containing protein [Candidatus Kaiserbacteria bacterium]